MFEEKEKAGIYLSIHIHTHTKLRQQWKALSGKKENMSLLVVDCSGGGEAAKTLKTFGSDTCIHI